MGVPGGRPHPSCILLEPTAWRPEEEGVGKDSCQVLTPTHRPGSGLCPLPCPHGPVLREGLSHPQS